MNHKYRHADERCITGITSAMLSDAVLPERLKNAFDRGLGRLLKDEFPEGIWDRVERLRGAVKRSSAMTHDKAVEGLKEMLAIYEGVAEAYYGPQ